MPLFAVSAAGFAVVSTADAKEHLAVLHSDHDTLIASLVGYSTELVQNMASIQIPQKTLRVTLDSFPSDEIILPRPPVQSITSIKYYDSDNVLQTWSNTEYESDLYADSPWVPNLNNTRIRPSSGFVWPTVYSRIAPIQINYVSGWKTAASVPGPLIQATKIVLADLYEHREDIVIGHITANLKILEKLVSTYRSYFEETR